MWKVGWVTIVSLETCPHRVVIVKMMNESLIAWQIETGAGAKCPVPSRRKWCLHGEILTS